MDDQLRLIKEDIWCFNHHLDTLGIPRADDRGNQYSIVGRVKLLEKQHLKTLSELESHYLKNAIYLSE